MIQCDEDVIVVAPSTPRGRDWDAPSPPALPPPTGGSGVAGVGVGPCEGVGPGSPRVRGGGPPTPDNGSLPFLGFPLPLPAETEPYPGSVMLRINQLGTKTARGVPAPPILLLLGPDARTYAVRALARYLPAVTAPASPYLFRPLDRSQEG